MTRRCSAAVLVASMLVLGCGKTPNDQPVGSSDQGGTTDWKEAVAICDRVQAAGGRAERNFNSPGWEFDVSLPDGPVADELWADIRRLPGISYLSLHGKHVTDETLKTVSGLRPFRGLSLVDTTQVTEAGFSHVSKLSQLNSLLVCRMPVPDDALSSIGKLESLKYLTINECEMSPTGLRQIQGLAGLEWLHVMDTGKLTDEGLRSLASLPRLRSLELTNTKITDDGLKELRGCEALTELDLSDSPVTGSGFVHLQTLPALEHLTLQRTKVTDDNLSKLVNFKALESLHDSGFGATIAG